MPGLKSNAIAGPILAFSIQAPHSFWERSGKPILQMRIVLDKLSVPMQQMPAIFLTLCVGGDKRRIFLGAGMMEDGKRVLTRSVERTHSVPSFPRAWRYSATTVGSDTWV